MCNLCLQIPCNLRCQNASEPTPIYVCEKCRSGIYEGDKFFDSLNGIICNDCLEDMTIDELLVLCDMRIETAYKEE